MDRTVKIRPYSGDAKNSASQSNLTEDQDKSLELAKKNALLEEEKKKSLEQLQTIEQLRENLRQEQAKTAEAAKKAVAPDANELAIKEAQLEEEKSRALENLKTIVQLRESLKQEQAKNAEMLKMLSEQEARIKASAASEKNELAQNTALLEEEKRKSLEQLQTIDQLRESLGQEQAKTAGLSGKIAGQEAMAEKSAALQARLEELRGALEKIAAIAAGKTV